MFMVMFAQTLMLVVLGQLFLGVNYMREALGTLLVVAAVSLWVACLGLLICAISKEENADHPRWPSERECAQDGSCGPAL
jgi:hypothetical protein